MQANHWSVIAIVNERLPMLERFVAWYLHHGADRILLYFDDPDDPGIAHMAPHGDRVSCTPCTRAFWEGLGVADAPNFTKKQNAAMLHGYGRIRDGWVVVVDADELILPMHGSLTDMLTTLPAIDRSVLIKPVEYVRCPTRPDATHFRRAMRPAQVEAVYGNFSRIIGGNRGMVGHLAGKSITRAGLEVSRAHPHWFFDAGGKKIIDNGKRAEDGCALLHFYCLDYEDWRHKMRYRLRAQGAGKRDALLEVMQFLSDKGAERRLRRMWRRMHEITSRQRRIMEREGLIIAPDLPLDRIIEHYFPRDVPAQKRAA